MVVARKDVNGEVLYDKWRVVVLYVHFSASLSQRYFLSVDAILASSFAAKLS